MKHYVAKFNVQPNEGPEIISFGFIKASTYEKAEIKARKIAGKLGGGMPDPGQDPASYMIYFRNGGAYVMLRELHEVTAEEYAVLAKYLH